VNENGYRFVESIFVILNAKLERMCVKGIRQEMSAGRNISDAFVFSCPCIRDY